MFICCVNNFAKTHTLIINNRLLLSYWRFNIYHAWSETIYFCGSL